MPPIFDPPPLNRIVPRLGPEHFKSYSMSLPLSTHWVDVSCEEYECEDFINGFVLTVDVRTELGQKQFEYVTHDKTRSYSMQRLNLYEYKFIYPPGTPGFAGPRHDHKLPNGRNPHWLVKGGDWRGNPRGIPTRQHTRAEHWVEDLAENQNQIIEIQKRG